MLSGNAQASASSLSISSSDVTTLLDYNYSVQSDAAGNKRLACNNNDGACNHKIIIEQTMNPDGVKYISQTTVNDAIRHSKERHCTAKLNSSPKVCRQTDIAQHDKKLEPPKGVKKDRRMFVQTKWMMNQYDKDIADKLEKISQQYFHIEDYCINLNQLEVTIDLSEPNIVAQTFVQKKIDDGIKEIETGNKKHKNLCNYRSSFIR